MAWVVPGYTKGEQAWILQVPLIDLEPWYSYVLKTERPEVAEGTASSTPSRASTTYEPEQKVTVSLLVEISKEIMSLYGKAKKGDASASQSLCMWLGGPILHTRLAVIVQCVRHSAGHLRLLLAQASQCLAQAECLSQGVTDGHLCKTAGKMCCCMVLAPPL